MSRATELADKLELMRKRNLATDEEKEAAKLLRQQEAVIKQMLEFTQRIAHWQEGKPDLHDIKVMLKEILK
jgi:hypothetical protein